jgi:GxxExxY protein
MLRVKSPLSAEEESVMTLALDVGFSVHRELGPGFKEAIYEEAYCLELHSRGAAFERERRIVVPFKQWSIPGQRIDLIVERLVIIELKAVPKLRRIHHAQLTSYLKATRLRAGLLMNFNAEWFKAGVRRVVFTPERRTIP